MSNVITIARGDTKTFDVTFTESDGSALDITGYKIYFTVRERGTLDTLTDNDDADAVISKVIDSFDTPLLGVCSIELSKTDTDVTPKKYVYDIQIKDDGGGISTVVIDDFIVLADVTRENE